MHDAHAFLQSLTIVLVVAAVTTVVFQWLRQPVVLGYLIAGLIVGPHLPIPLVADPDIVRTLSEFGVILLMFSIGRDVERLVEPVRDIFAAVFFVPVGMLIDPALVARHWVAVLVLTIAVVVGKVVGVSVGAFLTGNGLRPSIQTGMSLAQIGEALAGTHGAIAAAQAALEGRNDTAAGA